MQHQRAGNGPAKNICQLCLGNFEDSFVLSETSKPSNIHRPEPNQNGTLPNGHGSNGYITRGNGGLHEDADFPTNLKTLTRRKPITWMRPHVNKCYFNGIELVILFLQ